MTIVRVCKEDLDKLKSNLVTIMEKTVQLATRAVELKEDNEAYTIMIESLNEMCEHWQENAEYFQDQYGNLMARAIELEEQHKQQMASMSALISRNFYDNKI